jgi:hypothetical protein
MAAMTSGPGFRLARAAIFAAVCVVTTALGHALMSGHPLPGWAVGCAFAATTAGGWWLTGRERAGLSVTGATVGAQVLLHTGFSLAEALADRAAAPTPADGMPGAGRIPGAGRMSGEGRAPGMGEMPGVSGMGMPGMAHEHQAAHGMSILGVPVGDGWSAGMTLAHMLAAVVCGLWLWRGQAAAFRLGRSLAAFVFAPLQRARGTLAFAGGTRPRACPPACVPAACRPYGPTLRHVVSRRGPPGRPVCC